MPKIGIIFLAFSERSDVLVCVGKNFQKKGEGLPNRPLLLKDTCLEFVYLKNQQPDGLIVSEGGGEGRGVR